MKVRNVYIGRSVVEDDELFDDAEIEVPGLGKVRISNCLSDETREQIMAEVEKAFAARLHGKVAMQ